MFSGVAEGQAQSPIPRCHDAHAQWRLPSCFPVSLVLTPSRLLLPLFPLSLSPCFCCTWKVHDPCSSHTVLTDVTIPPLTVLFSCVDILEDSSLLQMLGIQSRSPHSQTSTLLTKLSAWPRYAHFEIFLFQLLIFFFPSIF